MFGKKKDERAEAILKMFKNFGIKMELVDAKSGPLHSRFMFRPITPIRMKDLVNFDSDLCLALGAYPIRIEAPILGTKLIGIEVPNEKQEFVDIKELWENPEFLKDKRKLIIPFGRTVDNEDLFIDLFKLPHLLISGMTGSGKSTFLHCLISSLMKKFGSEEVKFILVDNKRVEFQIYSGIPYLLTEPIVETEKTISALRWLNGEMEKRFKLLDQSGSMDINDYNSKSSEKMRHILFINEEFIDDICANKKDFEEGITKILQMGGAVGLHIILATSRPEKRAVSSAACANITARLCFKTASPIDSKEILDQIGAERLLGHGDALFLDVNSTNLTRLQVPFILYEELMKNVEIVKQKITADPLDEKEIDKMLTFYDEANEDILYVEAKKIVIEAGAGSASLIQRRLRVGYARAARLLDMLEEAGVVGEGNGAEPRKILKEE